MDNKKKAYIRTYTGVKFHIFDPRHENIYIEDISHALSLICRFTGHTSRMYSVAQHSMMVAKELKEKGAPVEVQMFGLLHDASEAYICDLAKPIKDLIPGYAEVEKKIQDMIYFRFLKRTPTKKEKELINEVDKDVMCFELKRFFSKGEEDAELIEHSNVVSFPFLPETSQQIVKDEFLLMFINLRTKIAKT